MRPSLVAALAAGVGLAALAALVVAGALTGIDQYAVDHWMPRLEADNGDAALLSWRLLHPHLGAPLQAVYDLWTFPASPLVSTLLLAAGCLVLARRGRRDAALAWAVAWVLANAVEVLGKGVLRRPTLHVADGASRGDLHGFDSSFPSGHAMRAVLLAALVAAVWPRFAVPALVWAALVLPALVLNGDHTPTDAVAGALIALVAAAGVETWLGARSGSPARVDLRAAVAEDG